MLGGPWDCMVISVSNRVFKYAKAYKQYPENTTLGSMSLEVTLPLWTPFKQILLLTGAL